MNQSRKNIFYALFGILIIALFGLVMAHELKRGDFPQHIAWAKDFADAGYLYKIPHTLFSKLVVIIRALLPANILVRISTLAKQVYDLKSYEISAWLLMILSYLATAIILIRRAIKEWAENDFHNKHWYIGLLVLIVLLVGPVFIFTITYHMYTGYIVPNPYHSPTYVLLRPFAVLIFFEIVDNLFSKWKWTRSILTALLIVCASLAKPNFTITIMPALGLLIVLFYFQKIRNINWFYVIGSIGFTSIIVLISQFIINYSGDRGEGILLAPFKSMLNWLPNIPSVLACLFLSLLFPILVAVFYWDDLKSKLSFRLACLNLIVAIVIGYLFVEEINWASNNFWWGAMIGLFILFFETIIVFGKRLITTIEQKQHLTWKNIVLIIAIFMHLACGIIYYVVTLLNTTAPMVL